MADLHLLTPAASRADLIREAYAALNRGDLDGYAGMYDVQVITVAPQMGNPVGRAAVLSPHRARRVAFPDIRWTVEEVIESGDRTAALLHAEGTHSGPLGRHAATHRFFRLVLCEIAEWRNNRAVTVQTFSDQLHLLQQLGLA
jgi:predicted ester cyclase